MCFTSYLGLESFEAKAEGAERVIVQKVFVTLVCTQGNYALQYSQPTCIVLGKLKRWLNPHDDDQVATKQKNIWVH